MAYEIPGFKFSLEASVDLSAKQYHFAAVPDVNGRVTFTGTQGIATVGVIQNKPSALGVGTELMVDGITKLVAHAAVAAGAAVSCSNTGRAITAAAGNRVHGYALEAAVNAGEIITVLLNRNGHIQP